MGSDQVQHGTLLKQNYNRLGKGLLTGSMSPDSSHSGVNSYTFWHSATAIYSDEAFYVGMSGSNSSNIEVNFTSSKSGESIRCVYGTPQPRLVAPANLPQSGTIIDRRDDQDYNWVRIGRQVWLAENVNFDAGEGSYCYDDSAENCETYGRLYDYETAMQGSESNDNIVGFIQGICPEGWHIPMHTEWDELGWFVSEDQGLVSETIYWDGVAPFLMAESLWEEYEGIVASDTYGFRALGAGIKSETDYWIDLGYSSAWYSTSGRISVPGEPIGYTIWNSKSSLMKYTIQGLMSTRCIKDFTLEEHW